MKNKKQDNDCDMYFIQLAYIDGGCNDWTTNMYCKLICAEHKRYLIFSFLMEHFYKTRKIICAIYGLKLNMEFNAKIEKKFLIYDIFLLYQF